MGVLDDGWELRVSSKLAAAGGTSADAAGAPPLFRPSRWRALADADAQWQPPLSPRRSRPSSMTGAGEGMHAHRTGFE